MAHLAWTTLLPVAAFFSWPLGSPCLDTENRSLAAEADLIVVGHIAAKIYREAPPEASPTQGYGAGHTIAAHIDFEVEESLKGAVEPGTIRIYSPGGQLNGEVSPFGDYLFSYYEPGDRALVYLVASSDSSYYQVLYHYFKISGGVVVDAHNLEEPPVEGRLITERDLRAAVSAFLQCSYPTTLGVQSDAVLRAVITDVEPPAGSNVATVCHLEVLEAIRGAAGHCKATVAIYPWDHVSLHEADRVVLFLRRSERDPAVLELTAGLAGCYWQSGERVVGKMGAFTLAEFRSLVE